MRDYAMMIAVLAVSALPAIGGEPAAKLEKLPEGNAGIAARYPGDSGIRKDPAVVFADDFEGVSSAADLSSTWDFLTHEANLSIANESANENGGRKSLLITIPQQKEPLAVGVDKLLKGNPTGSRESNGVGIQRGRSQWGLPLLRPQSTGCVAIPFPAIGVM